MTDLVEKVARGIKTVLVKETGGWSVKDNRIISDMLARAAINMVLEEAAKVCSYQDEYDDALSSHAEFMTCARIAAAIRAMKEDT